ncbi:MULTISPECIES: AraC family transcriptional regulator [Paenibacillus]|uniref:AraC family transcriptional regulator n=1 Tax=Paenibacillus TaxID=44249 RepID=UPI00096C7DE7|nr:MULTISPECIES: AraC family transcriptional regulator [Paenibacillus]OMF82199.1 AraC family transcriptional regulator [Paenibacillus peoriae]
MILTPHHLRFFLTTREHSLPLFIESIGFNSRQEDVSRPEGYPCFHWIQTVSGEGMFTFKGGTFRLGEQSGVLLLPGESHAYRRATKVWRTLYITFDGPIAAAVLTALGLKHTRGYHWDPDSELHSFGETMLHSMVSERDLSGLDASANMYRFLTLLRKYGQHSSMPSLSHNVERLTPVLAFMEQNYASPDVGLGDMAVMMNVSSRHLNTLFKQAFGVTSYAYLIVIRLRKAKEMMTEYPQLTVKEISERVGFRDASHFVATFRRAEGITPERFKLLYT